MWQRGALAVFVFSHAKAQSREKGQGFSQGAQSAQRKGMFFLRFIPAGSVNSVRYLTLGTL